MWTDMRKPDANGLPALCWSWHRAVASPIPAITPMTAITVPRTAVTPTTADITAIITTAPSRPSTSATVFSSVTRTPATPGADIGHHTAVGCIPVTVTDMATAMDRVSGLAGAMGRITATIRSRNPSRRMTHRRLLNSSPVNPS